jgi:hypothetical protein
MHACDKCVCIVQEGIAVEHITTANCLPFEHMLVSVSRVWWCVAVSAEGH